MALYGVSVLWGGRQLVWSSVHGGTGAGVGQAGVAYITGRGRYVGCHSL